MNYMKIYTTIIEHRKQNIVIGYSEKHHIIPRCMDGTDEPENLVSLTAREHFIVHQLLAKIYKTHGLITAAYLMSSRKLNNSRMYAWLREQHSLKTSIMFKNKPKTAETIQKMKDSFTAERKLQISINRTGTKHSNQTITKMRGKKHTDESKQKISQSKIGIPRTEKTKQKVSASKIGVPLSDSHKEAIKIGTIQRYKDNPVSEETRLKIGNLHRGKKYSDETKRKIGESSKGRQGGAKNWVLQSPDGIIYHVHCLNSFCKEHGLTWKAISKSYHNNEPITKGASKGWIVISRD